MPRFPVKPSQITNNQAVISGPDYRHIIKVLRLKPGDEVILFEENGIEYTGRIKEVNSKELKVLIIGSRQVEVESMLNITLLQGIPKGDKMDFIVEKATELGVKSVIPVITERSQIRQTQKIKRWQRITIESSKQCGRIAPPKVYEVIDFSEAINNKYNSSLKLILYEKCEDRLKGNISNILQAPENIAILIGPEGGFSEGEVRKAQDKGFVPVRLGPRILRTETAGIVVMSILQFLYGDI